jgi:hypothetical protein
MTFGVKAVERAGGRTGGGEKKVDAEVVLGEPHELLHIGGILGDGELRAAGFPPVQKAADRFYGQKRLAQSGVSWVATALFASPLER